MFKRKNRVKQKGLMNFFRKYHKWSGIILTLLLILFSLSGIVLNHRSQLANVSVSRNVLPKYVRYSNWNNAAVKDMYGVSRDSVMVYGNIGVWLTDSTLNNFEDMNIGFPSGIDNRKINKIIKYNNSLYAGTLYGLFAYNQESNEWEKQQLPLKEEHVVDMYTKGDTLHVMLRSHLLITKNGKHFYEVNLPEPAGYDNKIGLFKTLWVLHSGEIYGDFGIMVVDLIGIVMVFMSITGFILYLSKENIKNKKNSQEIRRKHSKRYRWNIKWHNKIGWITIIFLFVNTTAGMFLRPPLLAAIFTSKVAKIPYTELDTPNAWYDILRRGIYMPEDDIHIISTYDGFYYTPDNFTTIIRFDKQPPASVMGVTVFEDLGDDKLLIGSFEGLFEWSYKSGYVFDKMKGEPYVAPIKKGPPVGDFMISGYGFDKNHNKVIFDYMQGVVGINADAQYPEISKEILKKSPMSLWGLSLEIHTGRIYQPFLGILYILVVPLVGLFTLFNLITGFVIWYKYYWRRKKR